LTGALVAGGFIGGVATEAERSWSLAAPLGRERLAAREGERGGDKETLGGAAARLKSMDALLWLLAEAGVALGLLSASCGGLPRRERRRDNEPRRKDD
jgi:hypothetical protein